MQPKSIFLSSLGAVRTVIVLTVVNLLIITVRNYIEDDKALNFLLFNLFSGFVPLLIAYLLLLFNQKISLIIFWLATLLWVLFYPNSPYMISDLIHESIDDPNRKGLYIYDTLIIFSIAMLSVFYGFMSIKIMYSLVEFRYNARLANVFITITILLSSVGFYLGRVVKGFVWNSDTSLVSHDASTDTSGTVKNLYTSDLFLHPIETFQKIWDSLFPISTHTDAYYMMALITIIQFSLLTMMRDVEDFQKSDILTRKIPQSHETLL